MRVLEEFRGNSASFSEAAKRSSIGNFLSCAIVFNFARRLANFFAILRRLLFFSIELFLAILSLLAVPRMRNRPHCRNGKLNAVSSARASSSLRALVQTV